MFIREKYPSGQPILPSHRTNSDSDLYTRIQPAQLHRAAKPVALVQTSRTAHVDPLLLRQSLARRTARLDVFLNLQTTPATAYISAFVSVYCLFGLGTYVLSALSLLGQVRFWRDRDSRKAAWGSYFRFYDGTVLGQFYGPFGCIG
jgi:hypothetical protein